LSTTSNSHQHHAAHAAEWHATANPWIAGLSVMLATFMVVLDSSIANVALPHIAGSLSASTDESTWVLTSYLVANAIMLPASGWIARRIGRKRLLLISIFIFTCASILCGISLDMPMLIVARILQGAGGGGMQPLAQSILLESFPAQKQGKAMAMFGIGTVVAPIIGPTLGGWITDSYSWRWIFYINLPVGLLALLMVNRNVEDPPYLRHGRRGAIDSLGFGLMALWLGTMQLVLDKGQEADWFEAPWICWMTAISAAAFLAFVVRELLYHDPIVQLHALKDRSFRMGTVVTGFFGVLLYGITAFLPLFLQTLLGYSAMDSGLAVSPRGLGSMLAMVFVGYLVSRYDSRILLAFGMGIFGVSSLMLSRVNLGISMAAVAWPNFLNGFGGGFVFVPLTTLAMGRLRQHEIGNAAGIYNLVRNVGGSIGIAALTAAQVRGVQIHQSYLGANLTAGNFVSSAAIGGLTARFAAGGANQVLAQHIAAGTVYGNLQRQAAVLAYADNFRLLGYLALGCMLLAFLFKRPQPAAKSSAATVE
jgi:DHA2 family multidrug resistance protein